MKKSCHDKMRNEISTYIIIIKKWKCCCSEVLAPEAFAHKKDTGVCLFPLWPHVSLSLSHLLNSDETITLSSVTKKTIDRKEVSFFYSFLLLFSSNK